MTRYTLSELGALAGVHAEEVHEAGEPGAAVVKARSWLRLRLEGAPADPADPAVAEVADVSAELPPGLRPLPLPLEPVAEADDADPEVRPERRIVIGDLRPGYLARCLIDGPVELFL